jgi:hypothetical protein
VLDADPCSFLDAVRPGDRARFHELALDQDHARETVGSRREARVALTLEYRGLLPGPVERARWADIRDGSGQEWDIKSPHSAEAIRREGGMVPESGAPDATAADPPGAFRLEREVARLAAEQQLGFGIVLDVRRLTVEQARDLIAAVAAHERINLELVRVFPPDFAAFESNS